MKNQDTVVIGVLCLKSHFKQFLNEIVLKVLHKPSIEFERGNLKIGNIEIVFISVFSHPRLTKVDMLLPINRYSNTGSEIAFNNSIREFIASQTTVISRDMIVVRNLEGKSYIEIISD